MGGLNNSSSFVDGSYCVLNRLWGLNNSSNGMVMFIWLFAS